MDSYKPIPVEVARSIAETYGKSIVIIHAHDPEHGMLHTTTFGVSPADKAWAAQGGEIANKALGGLNELATSYEDYRLTQAKKLLAALKLAVSLAGQTFEALGQRSGYAGRQGSAISR